MVPIEIPPLRERSEDIELAGELLRRAILRGEQLQAEVVLGRGRRAALRRAAWRGNVRELRNAVERLLIMSPGDAIGVGDLPAGLGHGAGPGGRSRPHGFVLAVPSEGLTAAEVQGPPSAPFSWSDCADNEWNVAATAKAIETPRSNLYKKLDAHEISRERTGFDRGP